LESDCSFERRRQSFAQNERLSESLRVQSPGQEPSYLPSLSIDRLWSPEKTGYLTEAWLFRLGRMDRKPCLVASQWDRIGDSVGLKSFVKKESDIANAEKALSYFPTHCPYQVIPHHALALADGAFYWWWT
jgi:hypothetical protein